MHRPIILTSILLLLAAAAVAGEPAKKAYLPNLAGTWQVNADGTHFIMQLRQSKDTISGEWYPAGGKVDDGGPIKGTIDAQWLVKLRQHGKNQNFEGYVFRECERTTRHIAGFFGEGTERKEYRHAWFATEQK